MLILFSRFRTFFWSQNWVLLTHEASNFETLTDRDSAALSTLNKYCQSFCIEFTTELSFSKFNKFLMNKSCFLREAFEKWKTLKGLLKMGLKKGLKNILKCFWRAFFWRRFSSKNIPQIVNEVSISPKIFQINLQKLDLSSFWGIFKCLFYPISFPLSLELSIANKISLWLEIIIFLVW